MALDFGNEKLDLKTLGLENFDLESFGLENLGCFEKDFEVGCLDLRKHVVGPLFRPNLFWRIRTESGMPLKSLNHSKSYLCESDFKIWQAHKHLHLTKYVYNEGIQAFQNDLQK